MSRYIISGGGTGGHIFPAISIANALREIEPECGILFIGAEGRMEMERVPAAGYEIVGLKVEGFDRKRLLRNVRVLRELWQSIGKAKKIMREFKPDVVVGVGGYASGAALKAAAALGIPILLQEQNGFAGVTNKLMAKQAEKICVAYEGMDKFFPKEKMILTGNPVRQNLTEGAAHRAEAYELFGLREDRPVLLIIGGSLGARTINESVIEALPRLKESGVQVIWQTGRAYIEAARRSYEPYRCAEIVVTDFVSRMDLAYAIADLVISRAGASSISELCLLGKAAILVPSPNVAEDHQTHNALALSTRGAAILVKDAEARERLIDTALATIGDKEKTMELSRNALTLAQRDSARRIAEEVIKLKGRRK